MVDFVKIINVSSTFTVYNFGERSIPKRWLCASVGSKSKGQPSIPMLMPRLSPHPNLIVIL